MRPIAVIPTYNERENVEALAAAVLGNLPPELRPLCRIQAFANQRRNHLEPFQCCLVLPSGDLLGFHTGSLLSENILYEKQIDIKTKSVQRG